MSLGAARMGGASRSEEDSKHEEAGRETEEGENTAWSIAQLNRERRVGMGLGRLGLKC